MNVRNVAAAIIAFVIVAVIGLVIYVGVATLEDQVLHLICA